MEEQATLVVEASSGICRPLEPVGQHHELGKRPHHLRVARGAAAGRRPGRKLYRRRLEPAGGRRHPAARRPLAPRLRAVRRGVTSNTPGSTGATFRRPRLARRRNVPRRRRAERLVDLADARSALGGLGRPARIEAAATPTSWPRSWTKMCRPATTARCRRRFPNRSARSTAPRTFRRRISGD